MSDNHNNDEARASAVTTIRTHKLKEKINELKRGHEVLNIANDSLSASIDILETQKAKLIQEKKDMRDEIESVIRENYNLKDQYRRVIDVNDEYVTRNSTLAKEKEKLREALGSLLHHCERYNRAEESLILAMEMEKAHAALR